MNTNMYLKTREKLAMSQEQHIRRAMSPRSFFRVLTAKSWLTFSKLMSLTDKMMSLALSRPSFAAIEFGDTDLMMMGRFPFGLPFPPTMLKPNPDEPLCKWTILTLCTEKQEEHQITETSESNLLLAVEIYTFKCE